MSLPTAVTIGAPVFARLLEVLREDGYTVLGPTVRDEVVGYGELTGVDDLPHGVGDVQEPGRYRLAQRDDGRWFGFAVGPSAPKRQLFPPRQPLWQAVADGDATFHVEEAAVEPARIAFVGIRPCELAAIRIQDRVFLQGPYVDRIYAVNRADVLLVAVECASPAGTCFCASMGTGPGADDDAADLVLTELVEGEHRFLVRSGTPAGAELLARLEPRPADEHDHDERERQLADATTRMGRHLDTDGLHDLLLGNLEHPRWEEVAERCLDCGNCTLVCPTCFCTTMEDTTDLTGGSARRDRRWDSCFGLEFTHAGPASVRSSTRARYRQWMTHKLATWIDQFDSSGCVGCGRCITWCPVGIDITEEAAAIRASDGREAVPTGAGR